jgi:hypothetical protein
MPMMGLEVVQKVFSLGITASSYKPAPLNSTINKKSPRKTGGF